LLGDAAVEVDSVGATDPDVSSLSLEETTVGVEGEGRRSGSGVAHSTASSSKLSNGRRVGLAEEQDSSPSQSSNSAMLSFYISREKRINVISDSEGTARATIRISPRYGF
jgi:hypothetical protein